MSQSKQLTVPELQGLSDLQIEEIGKLNETIKRLYNEIFSVMSPDQRVKNEDKDKMVRLRKEIDDKRIELRKLENLHAETLLALELFTEDVPDSK